MPRVSSQLAPCSAFPALLRRRRRQQQLRSSARDVQRPVQLGRASSSHHAGGGAAMELRAEVARPQRGGCRPAGAAARRRAHASRSARCLFLLPIPPLLSCHGVLRFCATSRSLPLGRSSSEGRGAGTARDEGVDRGSGALLPARSSLIRAQSVRRARAGARTETATPGLQVPLCGPRPRAGATTRMLRAERLGPGADTPPPRAILADLVKGKGQSKDFSGRGEAAALRLSGVLPPHFASLASIAGGGG